VDEFDNELALEPIRSRRNEEELAVGGFAGEVNEDARKLRLLER
jgi:hypothetical protein